MTEAVSVKVHTMNVGLDMSIHCVREEVKKRFLVFDEAGAWIHSKGIAVTTQYGDCGNEVDGLDIELWAEMTKEQAAEYYMRFR